MKLTYATTVNSRIALQTIRRGVLLEQYKNGEVRKVVSFLNRQVEPDLAASLQKYAGKEFTANRLRLVQEAVWDITGNGYKDMGRQVRNDLLEQAPVDAAATAKIVRQSLPLDIDLTVPSLAALRQVVTGTPINGHFVPEWFEALADGTARRVNQQVAIGYAEGEGIDQIVRRIVGTRANRYRDGILRRSRSDVESVVRTAIAGVSHNVRDETYRANKDIVKEVSWTAALDPRTCEVCMDLDGRTFDVDDVPGLPHVNCRCATVPVLASWKEMGLSLEELSASTRASMDGQVPESLTYPEWLRRQSDEVQAEALGVRKAELFRAGDLEISDFVGDNNRILTLKELEALVN